MEENIEDDVSINEESNHGTTKGNKNSCAMYKESYSINMC